MKKILLLFVFIPICLNALGQAYRGLNIAPEVKNTHNSHSGIEAQKIALMPDGAYSVTLFNANYNDPYNGVSYRTSYFFYWYLSYKGKRVSEYVTSTIGCRKSEQKTIWAWPNKVPKCHEKYVSVQFGLEPVKRDSRDDE